MNSTKKWTHGIHLSDYATFIGGCIIALSIFILNCFDPDRISSNVHGIITEIPDLKPLTMPERPVFLDLKANASSFTVKTRKDGYKISPMIDCTGDLCVNDVKPGSGDGRKWIITFMEMNVWHNVWVLTPGALANETHLLTKYNVCVLSFWDPNNRLKKSVSQVFTFVFGGRAPTHAVFAHFLCDFVLFLEFVPACILSRVTFVLPSASSPFALDILSVMDIKSSQVHFLPMNTAYFARTYVQFSSVPCLELAENLVRLIHKRLLEKYGDNYRGQFRNVIYIRRGNRVIQNPLEILEVFEDRGDVWEFCGDFSSFRESLCYYRESKNIFLIHGSVYGNFLMLESGTTIYDYQTMYRYLPLQCIAHSLRCPYIFTADRSVRQTSKFLDVSISRVLSMLRYYEEFLSR